MAGGQPRGPEMAPPRPARQSAHGHRGVGGAEDGGTGFGYGPAGAFGHHRQGRNVGGPALIGGHAKGGVALHVLDRAVALAVGELHILDGDIVLQVEPGAGL